ncbi:hypothetical protein GUJ93_ZPchr0006g41023 [Zizania palustris]|uniref:Uncharacterized protein n=1 Tax=Zizania palustris TaxID=103762 RepID=A0A8J5T765_ZIZPA|nr:hypothetical protein GUJ93_ZPchr0006g41023 [Zizania palustris]KAG8076765.1 hypothetical protein GUJ93_ZPchr0006g41023 [Zizania palustris]
MDGPLPVVGWCRGGSNWAESEAMEDPYSSTLCKLQQYYCQSEQDEMIHHNGNWMLSKHVGARASEGISP